mmetsp:Transcript_14344/g.30911  ORF Transcript_14344/g.30911 Transcript_14344/m.30911 type:complete len:366 (+) Transcript_14344:215-1312(+)|eukprot:CAMPEP_0185853894 /NCGR_PEP_ID=MMETSP1354-20130828/20588_1 /TAXON_ID=708628 /ORGANISM="Erythrolobus madagascarensis, Strain CCMP3276" /LENGTH=365 /DNA_ID=CAMNT_0028555515 /DNA_START=130 /DNA_END=1227 /DNA_ORIENTATION=+
MEENNSEAVKRNHRSPLQRAVTGVGAGVDGGGGDVSSGGAGQSCAPLLGFLRSRSSVRSDGLSMDLAGLGVLSGKDCDEALQQMCDDKLFLEQVEQLSRSITGEENQESGGMVEAVVDEHEHAMQVDSTSAAHYSHVHGERTEQPEENLAAGVDGRSSTSFFRDAIDATFEKLNQQLAWRQDRAAATAENGPRSNQTTRNSSGDSGRGTPGSPRRSMSSGGAATPLRGVARSQSAKRSSGMHSRFCHVCSRKGRKVQFAVCANFFVDGRCRKVICDRCLEVNGSRYTETVTNLTWTCFHCNNRCPPNARCKIYTRPSGLAQPGQPPQASSSTSNPSLCASAEMPDAFATPDESGTDFNEISESFY